MPVISWLCGRAPHASSLATSAVSLVLVARSCSTSACMRASSDLGEGNGRKVWGCNGGEGAITQKVHRHGR